MRRFQILVAVATTDAGTFKEAQEFARTFKRDTKMDWLIRDRETGAIYDLTLDAPTEPDSRRVDLAESVRLALVESWET